MVLNIGKNQFGDVKAVHGSSRNRLISDRLQRSGGGPAKRALTLSAERADDVAALETRFDVVD
jgi:hypothetical protein